MSKASFISRQASNATAMTKGKVHLLDYVAGNIRSLVNAIEKCGWEVEWIRKPEDVVKAEVGVCPVELFHMMPSRWKTEFGATTYVYQTLRSQSRTSVSCGRGKGESLPGTRPR